MKYTIRTTGTQSGKGFRHEFLRDGKLTSYAEYGPKEKPPARMRRWLRKLNAGEGHDRELSVLRTQRVGADP